MHSLNTGEAKGFYSDYPDTANLLKFVRYIEKSIFWPENQKNKLDFWEESLSVLEKQSIFLLIGLGLKKGSYFGPRVLGSKFLVHPLVLVIYELRLGNPWPPGILTKLILARSLYAKIDEKCVIKSTCLEAIKYN